MHRHLQLLAATIAGALLALASAAAQDSLFDELVSESRLALTAPDGFAAADPQPNPVLAYEHALRHDDGKVEVRYVVRPLGRIEIEYEDPHSAAPEPNHLFPLLFESLLNGLAHRGTYKKNEYPRQDAVELFNADWAAAAVLDIEPEFAPGFTQALVVAIHKDRLADAYTVILFNDYEASRQAIRSAVGSLRFASD